MVRPLLAPMAEGAAEKTLGPLPGSIRYRLRAMSAATDNVGLFFGEDFRRLRRHHLYAQLYAGVRWDPDRTAAYCPVGIPTAICAFAIHSARLWRLDRHLQRELDKLNAAAQAKGGVA
jgi:uncharacterized membrane protein